MPSTLAKEFINRKLQEYKEPVRKGKTKGEAVGLSSRKYTAALVMAIYALITQEVEAIIGTKRSLISKWRTEPKFLQQMEELCLEFVDEILMVLTAEWHEGAFADSRYYSTKIKKIIFEKYDNAVKNGNCIFLLRAWEILRIVLYDPHLYNSAQQ